MTITVAGDRRRGRAWARALRGVEGVEVQRRRGSDRRRTARTRCPQRRRRTRSRSRAPTPDLPAAIKRGAHGAAATCSSPGRSRCTLDAAARARGARAAPRARAPVRHGGAGRRAPRVRPQDDGRPAGAVAAALRARRCAPGSHGDAIARRTGDRRHRGGAGGRRRRAGARERRRAARRRRERARPTSAMVTLAFDGGPVGAHRRQPRRAVAAAGDRGRVRRAHDRARRARRARAAADPGGDAAPRAAGRRAVGRDGERAPGCRTQGSRSARAAEPFVGGGAHGRRQRRRTRAIWRRRRWSGRRRASR